MDSNEGVATDMPSKESVSIDHICNVNVNKLISDVQQLVVQFKENNELANTLNVATVLRDVVRQTNEGHMSLKRPLTGTSFNFDSLDAEPKSNGTYQLRELDAENRHLRSLYEDGQLTLFLVMQQHRKAILRLCASDRERSCDSATKELNEKYSEDEAKMVYNKFAEVAVGINEVLKNEESKRKSAQEEIHDLTIRNAVLRELLNAEDLKNIDIDSLVDRIENKTPVPTPNTSVVYIPPATESTKIDEVEEEELVEDPDHNKTQTKAAVQEERTEFVPSF